MTRYKVLRRLVGDGRPAFEIVGEIEAHSADQAVRKVVTEELLNELGVTSGRFVATPSRSWFETPLGLEVPPARIVVGSEPAGQQTILGVVSGDGSGEALPPIEELEEHPVKIREARATIR